jgi:hypothetical protein
MKTFLKLVLAAFVAGFLFAGYKSLEKWGYDWAESDSTRVELIGTIGMIPEQRIGYVNLDGAYNTATENLALSSHGQQYLLIFNKDSDLSALIGDPSDNKNTVEIQGKSIQFNPLESYSVIGLKSRYSGLIPTGPIRVDGRVIDGYIKDEKSDYYKIIVHKIIPLDQSHNERTIETNAIATYEKEGISFQYPSSWRPFASEAVGGMRTQMTTELRKFNRTIVSLEMYISPDEEVAFFVSIVQADIGLSADDILSERRKFYDDATRAGDVTRINKLETMISSDLPAVVEDVERSNGGRGHSIKLLKGRRIIELSLIVNDKGKYDKHFVEYEQILATLNVQD